MATYEESGVNIEQGDKASKAAYAAAKSTFAGRKGMIGEPVVIDGGFAGLLDFGDFYLVQNDDGVGSKIEVARLVGDFSTVGYDLLAMVADDAVCMGAEVVSITNTIDCNKVDPEVIAEMLSGLATACREQKIVIPGGEVAEMGSLVNGWLWNAAAVGVVAKNRVITGADIKPGNLVIGLSSVGFRSNGFSLVRHILQAEFGEQWYETEYEPGVSWGQAVLTPCKIYHDHLLALLGRYGQQRRVEMNGIVHITGGGLIDNVERILPDGVGVDFTDLMPVPEVMQRLVELGNVDHAEAYKTWNMGMAMCLFVEADDADTVIAHFQSLDIPVQIVGEVSATEGVRF